MRARRVALCVVALLCLASPASAQFSTADLAGAWSAHVLKTAAEPSMAAAWLQGALRFDATGALIAGGLWDPRDEPVPVAAGGLRVSPDGRVDGTIGGAAIQGRLLPGKSQLVAVATSDFGTPAPGASYVILTRSVPATAFAPGDLAGTWRLNRLLVPELPALTAEYTHGQITFAADGGIAAGAVTSSHGLTTTVVSGEARLAADGALSGTLTTGVSGDTSVVGGVMDPSRRFVVGISTRVVGAGSDAERVDVGLFTLDRMPAGSYVKADADGRWELYSVQALDAQGGLGQPLRGTVVADSQGNLTGGTLIGPDDIPDTLLGGSIDVRSDGAVLAEILTPQRSLVVHGTMLPTRDQIVGVNDLVTDGAAVGILSLVKTNAAPLAVVQLSHDQYTATEGTPTVTITAVRSGSTATAFTVGYRASPGTAVAGRDFTPVTGTLSFPAGVTRRTFTIPVLDDAVVDGDRTVLIALDEPVGPAVAGFPTAAVLTIRDDDKPGTFRFDRATYAVGERASSVVVVVQRLGKSLAQDVTVHFATAEGTATDGADYIGQAGTLTFRAGEATKRITIALRRDALVEPVPPAGGVASVAAAAESFTVTLSNPTGGATLGTPPSATVTIRDDDVAGQLAFARTAHTVAEGAGTVTLTVTRAGGSAADVMVDWATVDGTALAGRDYVASSGTLIFGEGVRSATITVPIREDAEAEGSEAFRVELRDPRGGATLGPAATATVTIVDDEPAFHFDASVLTVKENARNAVITVRRSGPLLVPAAVSYTATALTAVAGRDFTPVSGTLTFGPRVASRTFTVPIQNNSVVDAAAAPPAAAPEPGLPPRSIRLALSAPTPGIALGSQATATLSVVDDDEGGTITLERAAYTVTESAAQAVLVVRRTGTSLAGDVSVRIATTNGTATAGSDYVGQASTIVFGPGETLKRITIPIVADTIVEGNETFTVSLSEPTGGGVLGTPSSATVTIAEDDVAGVAAFSAPVYRVAEDGGAVTLVVVRSGGRASAAAVDYTTVTGSAEAARDYTPISGTITFAANQTTATLVIPILQDADPEAVESFSVVLGNPRGGLRIGTPSQALVLVKDDDSVVQFSGRVVNNLPEVVRTGALDQRVTVDFVASDGTAEGGADFAPMRGTVVFNPGIASRLVPLTIVNDRIAEGPETFWVELENPQPVGAARLGPDSRRLFTITDNDSGGTVEFGAARYTAAEGHLATITIVRTGGTGTHLTVSWQAGDGTATAGNDFSPAAGTVTFGPRDRSKTFTIALVGDDIAEARESVPLTLSVVPGSATVGARALTVLEIEDAPAPQFETAQLTAGLGEDKTITIVRGGGLGRTFTVQWNATGGSAAPGQHFTPASGTVTFGPDDTSRSFVLRLADDPGAQPDRTVVLGLAVTSGAATVGTRSTATLTVIGSASTLGFPLPVYSVTEGSGPAIVTIVRGGNPNRQLRVDYATADATALAGRDYLAASGSVTFAAGQQVATFTVPIIGNGPSGEPRAFHVVLTNPSPNTLLGEAGGARVEIHENPVHAFEVIADTTGAIRSFDGAPSLNDAATVAFKAVLDDGSQRIFTGNGGPLTTVAGSAADGLVDFPGTRLSIDAAGRVVFRATPGSGGQAIYQGAGGPLTPLARTGNGHAELFDPATSANGTFVFATRPAGGGVALVRGTTVGDQAVVQSTASGAFLELGTQPAVNDAGAVAFVGLTSEGQRGVFVLDPAGSVSQIASVPDLAVSARVSLDQWEQVAFVGDVPDVGAGVVVGRKGMPVTVLAGAADGFRAFGGDGGDQSPAIHALAGPAFLGHTDEASVILRGRVPSADAVIRVGDPLLGSNVAALRFGGINGAGQVAFQAALADGREVVAVATPAVGQADLAIGKAVDRPAPLAGTTVTFTVTVTNNGPSAVAGVQVADRLPSGYTLVSATPSKGSYDAASGIWQVGSLAGTGPRGTATLTLRAVVELTGTYTATASVSAASGADPNPGNDSATVEVTPIFQADVAVAKTVTSTSPMVGTAVTFTTVVTNLGPHAARGVQVTDTLPSGYAVQSAAVTQGAYESATGLWSVGDVTAGGSATLRIGALVLPAGAYESTAARTASSPADPEPANDRATVAVSPRTAVLLSTTGSLIGPGRSVAGTITLLTPAPAGGVTVQLAASPAGRVTMAPAAVTIAAGASTGTFTVSGITVGDVTVTGTAPGFEPGTVAVTVTDSVVVLGAVPSVIVGKDLQVRGSLTLGTPAPPGGLPVTLTSGDPTRVRLASSRTAPGSAQITLAVPGGATSAPAFFIQALDSAGQVTVSATAPGYAPDAAPVKLVPSGFVIVSPAASFDTLTVSGNTAIVVAPARLHPQTLELQQRQLLRGGIAPVSVPVMATDQSGGPGVGTITTAPLVFNGGDGERSTEFDPALPGTSLIEVVSPAPFATPTTSRAVSAAVARPTLTLARAIVGPDHPTQGSLTLGAPAPAGGLAVTVTSADPGKLRLAASRTGAGQAQLTVTVPAGQTSTADFFFQALGTSGEITVTATAPGYEPGAAGILLVPPTAGAASPVSLLRATIGKDLQVRGSLFLAAPARPGGLPVTMTSADPERLRLAFSRTGPGQASITLNVPEGQTNTSNFFVQAFDGSGEVPVIVSAPGVAPRTTWMTLAPAGFVIFSPASIATTTTSAPTSVLVVSARLDPDTRDWREIQELRGGIRSLAVDVTATDQTGGPGVGTAGRTPLLFNGGESSKFTTFEPGAPGTSLIRVVPPAGFSEPLGNTIPATVSAPALTRLTPIGPPRAGLAMSYCRLDHVPHPRNDA